MDNHRETQPEIWIPHEKPKIEVPPAHKVIPITLQTNTDPLDHPKDNGRPRQL